MNESKKNHTKIIKNINANFDLRRRFYDFGFLPDERLVIYLMDKKRGIVAEICGIAVLLDKDLLERLEVK